MPNTNEPSAPTIIIPALAGFRLSSSEESLSEKTRIAWMLWAPSGYGKTNLSGQLDELTQRTEGKRTLFIPLEAADGGGIATIRKRNVPMYIPKDLSDFNKLMATLRNDKTIGGVVCDSATELARQYIKPEALKYPARENVATRQAGVPTRSDYQTMGELMSSALRALLLLTKHEDPAYRKHVIITAADSSREEDERVVWVGPDLPGRLSREAVQMFQQVGSIGIKPVVKDGKRSVVRYLTFKEDGVKSLKDRFGMFPDEIPLAKETPGTDGETICSIWDKFWQPAVRAASARITSVG